MNRHNSASGTDSFFITNIMVNSDLGLYAFLVLMSLIVFHFCGISVAHSATLGGTVYVPNLHAKCLSSHQECLLETCASEPASFDTRGDLTSFGIECAETCKSEYQTCEDTLSRLRTLGAAVPLIPKRNERAIANMKKLIRKEQGYVD